MATASSTAGLTRILRSLLIPSLALLTALVAGAVVMILSGDDPMAAYSGLFQGAFGDGKGWARTIRKTIPFVLTGLSVALAFKVSLFNIGASGQFVMGSVFAVAVGINFEGLPIFIHLPLALIAGIVGGMLWGAIPGILKVYTGAHEVIVTIMLNYVASLFGGWTVYAGGTQGQTPGPLWDRTAGAISETPDVLHSAQIPWLFGPPYRVHYGVFLALAAAILVWWLIFKTPLGFEMRTVGHNMRAALYAGIRVNFTIILTMALAGGLAGLAGGIETLGLNHKFAPEFGGAVGFDGITVALLGQTHPIGVLLAAFMFGALDGGAATMQFQSGVPADIIQIIQALVLAFVAAPLIIRMIFRLRRQTGQDRGLRGQHKLGWHVSRNAPVSAFTHLRRRYGNTMIVALALVVMAILVNLTPLKEQTWLRVLFGISALNFTLRATVPLVLGALSGILCERSGIINIGIEGMMLAGAFAGFVAKTSTNHWPLAASLIFSVVVAMAVGGLMGAVHALFSIRFRMDQIISGTVIIILALGTSSYLYNRDAIAEGKFSSIPIPGLAQIPVIGPVLFDNPPITYLALIMVVVVHVGLFYTRWGLRTRAVGEHPRAADTVGINVNRYRYVNTSLGGMLAGLAGAFLVLEAVGQFQEGMTAGRGFISLAAMIFGNWNPIGALGAATLFGYTQALQNELLLAGVTQVPRQFISMLPYVVTIVAVSGLVGRVRPPAAEGKVYETEGS